MERLGGIDIDQAVLAHVDAALDGLVSAADPPIRRCAPVRPGCATSAAEAKEALSTDTDTSIPVVAARPPDRGPAHPRRVRGDGPAPRRRDRRRRSSGRSARPASPLTDVSRVLLVGGSSRIPLVAQLVRERTGIAGRRRRPPEVRHRHRCRAARSQGGADRGRRPPPRRRSRRGRDPHQRHRGLVGGGAPPRSRVRGDGWRRRRGRRRGRRPRPPGRGRGPSGRRRSGRPGPPAPPAAAGPAGHRRVHRSGRHPVEDRGQGRQAATPWVIMAGAAAGRPGRRRDRRRPVAATRADGHDGDHRGGASGGTTAPPRHRDTGPGAGPARIVGWSPATAPTTAPVDRARRRGQPRQRPAASRRPQRRRVPISGAPVVLLVHDGTSRGDLHRRRWRVRLRWRGGRPDGDAYVTMSTGVKRSAPTGPPSSCWTEGRGPRRLPRRHPRFDGAGSFYFWRRQRLLPRAAPRARTGALSQVAGTGTQGPPGPPDRGRGTGHRRRAQRPVALAVDRQGNLLIADNGQGVVRSVADPTARSRRSPAAGPQRSPTR